MEFPIAVLVTLNPDENECFWPGRVDKLRPNLPKYTPYDNFETRFGKLSTSPIQLSKPLVIKMPGRLLNVALKCFPHRRGCGIVSDHYSKGGMSLQGERNAP